MTEAPRLPPDVARALADGNRSEAIRRLRAATGLDMREAHRVIDAAEASNARGPVRRSPAADSTARAGRRRGAEHDTGLGRFLAILVVLLALLGAWLWYTGALPDFPGLPESPAEDARSQPVNASTV